MGYQRRLPSTPTGPGEPPETTPGVCPQCRSDIPEGAAWCASCGTRAGEPCWECGRALAPGAGWCAFCGQEATDPAVVACPQCGAQVGQGQGFCTGCGTQSRPVCEDCDRPLKRDWAYCPRCGGTPAGGADAARWDWEPVDTAEAAEPEPAFRIDIPKQDRPGEALNAQGIKAYEAEDYDEALRFFRSAIAAEPDRAQYHTNLGVVYGEMGDDLQAFAAYRRAIELDPTEVAAYLNMGYLYNERERQTEAREMWEKVVQVAPDSAEAAEARQNLESLEEV